MLADHPAPFPHPTQKHHSPPKSTKSQKVGQMVQNLDSVPFCLLSGNLLKEGDIIVDANGAEYDEVTSVFKDIDGSWVEFTSGDMGYADNSVYRVVPVD